MADAPRNDTPGPAPMADGRLEEVEARAAAATPGPWTHYDVAPEEDEEGRYSVVCTEDGGGFDVLPGVFENDRSPEGYEELARNHAFAAAARDDVPALCAEVRRLRAELARLTAALQRIRSECGAVCPEFETCDHPACSSSCGAWLIADAALAGMALESPPTKKGGPTP